jgi:hypothetical protein
LLNVSQIKAVKEAGFQKSTELLLYFDSDEKGVPTRLFNVNKKRKGNPPKTHIGDGKDPFINSFRYDEIFANQMDPKKGHSTAELSKKINSPDSMTASESLANFIGFCRENSPAKRYILFLVGHGLIVANDSFLLDTMPQSAISLRQLGQIIKGFKEGLDKDSTFELIGFHSCSMGAIEVACELKNTARFMIASEGFSYVGSWPYRQLMKKIFNVTESGLTDAKVQELLQRIYELSLHNAPDFAYCGYSQDLTLCSLAEDKIALLLKPLGELADTLKSALQNPRGRQLIQLAHLQSQSFWREEYTDIFDFCRCLVDNCERTDPFQETLALSCEEVMKIFAPKANPFDGLVVFSDNFGWEFQYARGLSIYFPWNKPLGDVENDPLQNYKDYAFTGEFQKGHSWLDFLETYWDATMRRAEDDSSTEFFDLITDTSPNSSVFDAFNENLALSFVRPLGQLNKPNGGMAEQPCLCPSVKNFPLITKLNRRIRRLSMTPRVKAALEDRTDLIRPDNEED